MKTLLFIILGLVSLVVLILGAVELFMPDIEIDLDDIDDIL